MGRQRSPLELGVPEVVVGLTIVAIGTSLPEVAASVAGALKGHPEIAIGNVVGSNIFNMGGVFAVAGLMTTVSIDSVTLSRDFGLMLGMTLLVAILAWTAGALIEWQAWRSWPFTQVIWDTWDGAPYEF